MRTYHLYVFALCALAVAFAPACQTAPDATAGENVGSETYAVLGYSSEVDWGRHLVLVAGCDDCHSPKKMTDRGPVPDPRFRMSGHRADAPIAVLDRETIEKNGYGACNPDMTSWIGPWGVSFAANLTPDETGIGNWTQEQFNRAMREGKFKGMEGGRTLLPPMPWPNFGEYNDAELSALFAFLQSLPAIDNVVPAPQPPVTGPVASAGS